MKTHAVRKDSRALGIWQKVMFTLAMTRAGALAAADDADRIQPDRENPYYWQYQGETVLLLGGSWQDNYHGMQGDFGYRRSSWKLV